MDKNDSVISSLLDSQQRLWQKYPTLAIARAENTALRETKNSVPKSLHDSCPIRGMRIIVIRFLTYILSIHVPNESEKIHLKIYLCFACGVSHAACRGPAAFQNVVLCAHVGPLLITLSARVSAEL